MESPAAHSTPSATPPERIVPLADAKANLASIMGVKLMNISWQGVLVAGGAVLAALTGLDKKQLWANSDVDIFLFGFNDQQMRNKIKELWTILSTTLKGGSCIKTPHTLSFVFPCKGGGPSHVIQVICRIFASPREILESFDVPCCCVAFDGAQFVALPRGIEAIATKVNMTGDLTRRAYNFETRLIKYARRGYAIGCPGLERGKIEIRAPRDWDPNYGAGSSFEPSPDDYFEATGLRKLLIAEFTRNATGYFGPKERATKFLLTGDVNEVAKGVRLLHGVSSRKKTKGEYGQSFGGMEDEYPPDMSWAEAAGLGSRPFQAASSPAGFLDDGNARIKTFPVGPWPRASGTPASQQDAWVGDLYKNRKLSAAQGVAPLAWPAVDAHLTSKAHGRRGYDY